MVVVGVFTSKCKLQMAKNIYSKSVNPQCNLYSSPLINEVHEIVSPPVSSPIHARPPLKKLTQIGIKQIALT